MVPLWMETAPTSQECGEQQLYLAETQAGFNPACCLCGEHNCATMAASPASQLATTDLPGGWLLGARDVECELCALTLAHFLFLLITSYSAIHTLLVLSEASMSSLINW